MTLVEKIPARNLLKGVLKKSNHALLLALILAFWGSDFCNAAQSPSKMGKDPFKNIQTHKLKNGLELVLNPGKKANMVLVQLVLNAGMEDEKGEHIGVAHLLEHLLFRDSKLPQGETLMEVIEKEGGQTNAWVSKENTTYKIVLPKDKAHVALSLLHRLLSAPEFNSEMISKAKGSVELEIEKAPQSSRLVGFAINTFLYQKGFKVPGFYESEFGIKNKNYTHEQEALNLSKLQQKHLEKFYKDHYVPSKMKLYISGNFNPEAFLRDARNTFGQLPAKTGVAKKKKTPKLKDRPFLRKYSSNSSSQKIEIGVKLYDIEVNDYISALIFNKFLAKKLKSELRNKKGETYTPIPNLEYGKKMGYSSVSFETTAESFHKNRELLKSWVVKYARNAEISEAEFKKSKKLVEDEFFHLTTESAYSLYSFSHYKMWFEKEFALKVSPFKAFNDLDHGKFRKSLQKIYTKNARIEESVQSHMFFEWEKFLFGLIAFLIPILLFQTIFRKPHRERNSRWVTKVRYSPALIVETFGLIFFTQLFGYHLVNFFEYSIFKLDLMGINIFVTEYLPSILGLMIFELSIMTFFMLLPRKLYIKDNSLVMTCFWLNNWEWTWNEIKDVKLLYIHQAFFRRLPWTNWKYIGLFTSWKFWKKGLEIHFKDGKVIYMSVDHPLRAMAEIKKKVPEKQSSPKIRNAA